MIGSEIAGYRILEKLGEGGMGVVYKAVDTSLDRQVAVKVLSADLARNPELVQRFRSEARAQANLNHTNLATLYAFLVNEGNAAMVMEFVDGETFEQMILRRGPIPSEEAVPLFRQALLGIGYAHRAGIVHRDIKPSNLMVNRFGIVKVMDFGIAKVMGSRGTTRTGTQMGTGWYMSPEQVLNKNVDIRSDIYSLGVTLYQMLTANVPFQGESDFEIMSHQVNTAPPPPSRYYPYLAKGLENAVLKALEKNPEARFQTVEEFGLALERPIEFAYAAPPVQPEPTPQTFRPAFVAATPIPQAPPPPTVPYSPIAAPAGTQRFTQPPQAQFQGSVQPPVDPQQPAQVIVPGPRPGVLGTPQRKVIAVAAGLLVLLLAVFVATRSNSTGGTVVLPSRTPQTSGGGPTPLEQQLSGSGGGSSGTSSALSTTPAPPTPPAAPALPKIVSFRPAANSVTAGQTARLSWSVTGASEITITPGVGTVKPDGSVDIPLRKTTEFQLVAKNQRGETASSSTTVTVAQAEAPPTPHPATPAPPAPSPAVAQTTPAPAAPPVAPPQAPPATPRIRPEIAFDAVPNQIQPGGATVLRWYLSNAESASIDPGPGLVRQATGQYRVQPMQTTTYTLTATSKDGTTATATTTVNVIGVQAQAQAPVPVRPGFAINVYHDHGQAAFAQGQLPSCWGQLQVAGEHLQFRVTGTNDGRRDDFDVQLAQVQEVAMNRMPIRNNPAFHIAVSGQHFNFVPVGASAVQAVNGLQNAMRQR